jgi:hypothetical protein
LSLITILLSSIILDSGFNEKHNQKFRILARHTVDVLEPGLQETGMDFSGKWDNELSPCSLVH